MNLTLILICAVIGAFAVASFYFNVKERKARKQAEKELKEARENEKKTVEKIDEANRTKAEARTGSHDSDFIYIANKLHDYANK